VTKDQTPNAGGPEDVERHDYAALVDSLTGILDLYGGLAEAVDVAAYTAMRSHIANLLNLEAGLQAALGAHHGTEQSIELGAATSIAELLLRAGAGNPAARDELVRRYSGVVLATVRSFRLQDADAGHAVQMTWLRLAENCHRIQQPERLGGWLATTARRECRRILRHYGEPSPQQDYERVQLVATDALIAKRAQRGGEGSCEYVGFATPPSLNSSSQQPSPEINTNVSNSARVWDYWLDGKDHYPVDREAGDQFAAILPSIIDVARASRAFLARAVRYLVREAGIRQFLDVGTGLPTVNNTHEVAQAIAPDCRIVYVDNDPVVLVHARALLTSTPEGVTHYVAADLRDTDTVLREAARTLDFTQPIALMLMGTIEHIMDTDEAYAIVHRLLDPLVSGSYLVLYDPTTDGVHGPEMAKACQLWNDSGGTPPVTVRSCQEIAGFFDRLELIEPGLVPVPLWRPDPAQVGVPAEVNTFGGVGRKP
jgi:hypothetical protein